MTHSSGSDRKAQPAPSDPRAAGSKAPVPGLVIHLTPPRPSILAVAPVVASCDFL